MLNILETLNFMVGDAQNRISVYQAPRACLKEPF